MQVGRATNVHVAMSEAIRGQLVPPNQGKAPRFGSWSDRAVRKWCNERRSAQRDDVASGAAGGAAGRTREVWPRSPRSSPPTVQRSESIEQHTGQGTAQATATIIGRISV